MMNTKKILVLEDNRVTIHGLKLNLQAAGYHVIPATTTTEAMNAVRALRPDLLILDVHLLSESPFDGVTDGFAFKQWVREFIPDTKIPVIFFTQDASPELYDRAKAQETHWLVQKQAGIDLLLSTVQQVLGDSKLKPAA
jgi:CheY-like chemotaxis protein